MDRRALRHDVLIALALAAILGLAWTWHGWADLSALRLPDTDDVMRLQQVRDWLGGQGFADLGQHRVAAGLPMHWSRLADLLPAATILALTPAIGVHGAQVAAMIAVPLALFAVALALIARIARTLGAEPGPAAVIAAIAYPATTIFAPGRIDHHGLQMVLLLAALLAMSRRGPGAGVIAGLAMAASLAIGLETAPLLALVGGAALLRWVRDGDDQTLQGLGIGALAGLAIGKGMFAPAAWDYPACDGFTAILWRAVLAPAAVPVVLGSIGATLHDPRRRLAAMLIAVTAAMLAAYGLSPQCLHPYGAVDPLLARLWLAQVSEAQPLFAAAPGAAIGYAGVMLAGLLATGWATWRRRTFGWATMLALLLGATLLTMTQLRGAYAGALLAAPGLALVVAAARARGALPLAGAWAASAGMLYPIAADALAPRAGGHATTTDNACTAPALLARLAALPPGLVIAPIDAGPAILAATPHRVLGAPYHRNAAGDLAIYRFYAGTPASAARVTAQWRPAYALVCAAMPGRAHADTMAAMLATRDPAGWHRIGAAQDGARIVASDVQ